MISLENFDSIKVDRKNMAVKIGSGVTYSQLLAELSQEQLAIINVPSLPHLNVIGSMVTGSHGGAAAYAELATML